MKFAVLVLAIATILATTNASTKLAPGEQCFSFETSSECDEITDCDFDYRKLCDYDVVVIAALYLTSFIIVRKVCEEVSDLID